MLDRAGYARLEAAGLTDVVAAGVDRVQVRERALGGAALLALVDAALAATRSGARRRGAPAELVVNRRADAAWAAGADGVHLGFDAATAADARALLGDASLIGVSCHAPEEVAAAEGASYAHLAPIHAPLSKRSTRPALGTSALTRAAACGRAVIAQGGVTAQNAAACVRAGAAGVAVTGAVLQAADPAAATRALREALDG